MEDKKEESWIIRTLTPKNTEEVKPGLFIQKVNNGYRMIAPAAWNGQINWRNFILGLNWKSSLVFFLIIMFMVWSYQHDNAVFIAQDKLIKEDPLGFCKNITTSYSGGSSPLNFPELKIDEQSNSFITSPIQDN